VVGAFGAALGTGVTFLVAATGGVLLHLNMPAVRRLLVAEITDVLKPSFRGQIVLERIGGIDLRWDRPAEIRGVRARLLDPEGKQAALVDGVRASIDLKALVQSLRAPSGPMRLDIGDLHLDAVDVGLVADTEGQLGLVRAFESAKPETTPSEPGRGVAIALSNVGIDHLWAHGTVAAGAPPLDVDVDGVHSRVDVLPSKISLAIDRARMGARGMPSGANPHGEVTFELGLPSASGQSLGMAAGFRGDVGGIPANANVTMDGQHLDAVLDVPQVSGERVRALAPEAPLHQDVSLHAEAHGNLPRLETVVKIGVGKGTIDAKGTVLLSDGIALTPVTAEVRHLDARAFAPDAPASDLSLDATANVAVKDGIPKGTFKVSVLPGTVGKDRVPAVRLEGDVVGTVVRAHGHASEPGAPADFAVTFRGPEKKVDFDVRASAADLERIGRIGPVSKGSARVHAQGTVALASSTIVARVEAEGHGIEREGAQIEHFRLTGTASGPLAHPFVDATVTARDVKAQDKSFRRASVQVRGPATAPVITAVLHGDPGTPRVEAGASLAFGSSIVLREPHVAVVQPGVAMTSHAKRIVVGKSGILVEDLAVEGLGEPARVNIENAKGTTRVSLHVKGMDVAKVAKLAQLDASEVRAGTVDADIELEVDKKGAHGTATAALDHAAFRELKDSSARVDATFDGQRVTANVRAALDDAAQVEVQTSELTVGGSPLDPAAWKALTGSAHLAGGVDLPRLGALLAARMPVTLRGGAVAFEANAGRKAADAPPDVNVSVHTSGLSVAGATWQLQGFDAFLDAGIAGGGKTTVAARVADAKSDLVTFRFASDLPEQELLRDPSRALSLLEAQAFEAHVAIPRRTLASMPAVLGTRDLAGEVELRADVQGTMLEPRVQLAAHSYGVKRTSAGLMPAIDGDVGVEYAEEKGAVDVHLRIPQGEILAVNAEGHAKVADFLHAPAEGAAWDASVRGKIERFPLESLGVLHDHRVRGHLSGDFYALDLHKNGHAHLGLNLDQLHVGHAHFRRGVVTADLDDKGARADIRLDQRKGFAEIHGEAGAHWGKALVPSLDDTRPLRGSLRAENFGASVLVPFLEPTVVELGGRIDADAKAELPLKGGGKPLLQGHLALKDGLIEVPAAGQSLHGIRAHVALDPNGVIRVSDVEAKSDQGRVTASGTARIDGTRLAEAQGAMEILKGEEMPLSPGGEGLGELYGRVELKMSTSKDGADTKVDVHVPSLHLALSDATTHQVAELGAPEHVRLGVRDGSQVLPITEGPPREEDDTSEAKATRTTMTLRLGNDVELKRGAQLRVQLEGAATLTAAEDVSMTGELCLPGGHLDVQGKLFDIERGTIVFTGDPTNPTATITAVYAATEGSRIYADYIGPIKSGKVKLRSEPARSESEILAILVYGTDSEQAPRPSGASAAGGVVGGAASPGLNKAVSDLTGSDAVTFRVDTSHSAPRPGVEFRVAKSVSLRLATVYGQPPLDQPDRNFVTLNWRFHRNWSAETTYGTSQSSILDLLWQRRY